MSKCNRKFNDCLQTEGRRRWEIIIETERTAERANADAKGKLYL